MPAEMKGAQKGFVCLQVKPSARLAYSFIPGTARSGKNPQLLVFLGGIDSSQKGWQGAFAKLMSLSEAAGVALPPMLAYDRYGVGASDQDPSDDGKPPEEYHDTRESMRDLRALITLFAREQLGLTEGKLQDLRIVFCAHSLGCCIARHYAEAYPGTVEAVLFIDSAIAGTAAEKLVPDPDIPDEWKARKWMVPEGTTEDHCRRAVRRAKQSHFSGYALTTKEKIRWDHMPKLLPLGSEPRLRGPNARLPLVTVLISDDTIMTPLLAKAMGAPEPLIRNTWHRTGLEYSQQLVHLQGQGTGKGPIVAKGCSHNVHRDGPDLVAEELFELLTNLSKLDTSKL